VEKALRASMIKKIEQMKVQDAVNPDDDACREYYEANLDKYVNPRRMKVQEIMIKNKKTADTVARQAKGGADFDHLTSIYNERSFTKSKKGVLGYITKSQYGDIGPIAAKLETGEIAGPIKSGNAYSIIKILDVKEKEQKPFDDAKSRVQYDLKKSLVSERRQQWLAEIREKVPVYIYEGQLRRTIPETEIS
jgi:parvulin-like peptidyl-prolyl isomerase